MKPLKNAFLILFLIASFVVIKGQSPSFYKLGEEELSGIKIYDLIQDNQHNYWLASDQGLIKYDGYSFKNINIDKSLSNSIFDLRKDYEGNIFFKNFSGQIFKITNSSCSIYYQIPDSLMSNEIYFEFNNKNELLIASSCIFKVNKDKEIKLLNYQETKSNHGEFHRLMDSSLVIHRINADELFEIKNNDIKVTKIKKDPREYIIESFYLNDQLQYYGGGTKNLLIKEGNQFYKDPKSNSINTNKSARYYSDNEHLCVVTYKGGIKFFDKNFKPLFNNKVVFKNNFISFHHKDDKNNVFLGTFGDGIIVIPDFNLIDINIPNEKITKITSTPQNIIFLGTQSGKIYQVDGHNKASLFWDNSFKNIEVLHFFEETNQLLFDNNEYTLINIKSKSESYLEIGTIKDISKINTNNYIIAANNQMAYFNPKTKKITPILNSGKRTYSSVYNPVTKSTYAGTTTGLKISNKNKLKTFTLKDKSITARDIIYSQGNVIVTTRKNGVLFFKNDSLINNLNVDNGFPTNSINQIKVYKKRLFMSSDLGIIVADISGKVLSIINKSSGLYAQQIIDFELRNNWLWIVTQKGVQKLNLNSINRFDFTPTISINQVLMNDSNLLEKKNSNFNHLQNKFEFIIGSNNIKYRDEIKYYYQLVGIDKGWQINDYLNNKIQYKSLPPGTYNFQVKSRCRTNESEILSYQFKIAPPFWNTWWFYLFSFLFFIVSIYLIFSREIKRQRKKIQLENELNTSKLIAIKSQMNPHFIFNAINSIQDLILKEDIDNSYNYIIKFSKLVRQTLSFSDKEFIDIEDEVELLEIYLELEKLRFKEDFEYNIKCDIDDLQVPPMLIQPFVENAIKHGLLHKEGKKILNITFKKTETLICTVTDNGIGRKKAQEIKVRQQKNHQSFSVNATKSRFKIMQSHYKQNFGVQFKDLTSKKENTGTIVSIKMPFKQNY